MYKGPSAGSEKKYSVTIWKMWDIRRFYIRLIRMMFYVKNTWN